MLAVVEGRVGARGVRVVRHRVLRHALVVVEARPVPAGRAQAADVEARGLDVTPALQAKMREAGDMESAAVLDVIYEDEKGHVAVGAKWFRFLCARQKKDPAATFQALVRANFRGPLKAPFNDIARAEAGLTPSFYRSMTASTNI